MPFYTKILFKSKFVNNFIFIIILFIESYIVPHEKRIELSEKANEIMNKHFFKAFNLLSKSSNISDVWHLMNEKIEPEFKRSFRMAKRRNAKCNYFAENASQLLFSNLESDLDIIEFNIYYGKRRSLHLERLCYSANNISRSLVDYSTQCFNEFYLHSVKQFTKAKEINSNYNFRVNIKLGDVYFVNMPPSFFEQSVMLFHLRESLKKGYKKYNFCYNETKKILLLEKIMEDENLQSDFVDDDVKISNNKKKKRKKNPIR